MDLLISEQKCFCHTTMLNRLQFLPLLSLVMNMIAHVSYDVKLLFSFAFAHGAPYIAPTARNLLCAPLLCMSCKWSPRDVFRSPNVRSHERHVDKHNKKVLSVRSLSSKFCDKESCHRPSCESKCLRTPSTTGNSPLSREGISSQVTGTRWTTSVIPSDVTVPGPHRRFDGALATPARCNLREERQEHVTDHVGRVASVDHGEDLLTLPAVPLLPAFGRELRGLSCCISRGWIHRLATRQRGFQELFSRRSQIPVQTHEPISGQACPRAVVGFHTCRVAEGV